MILHANGHSKNMLNWLYDLQDKCQRKKWLMPHKIPEEIFNKKPNYVFRTFYHSKPWNA